VKRFSNIGHSVMAAAMLGSVNTPVVSVMQYLGQWHLPAIGGLSGITYDSQRDWYYVFADERSGATDVGHHTVRLALSGNGIDRAEFLGTQEAFDEGAFTGFDGVSDVAALSDTSFLAVERAAAVSIYRADVDPASDVLTTTPVVDLSAVPALRPLDNIAGITLGPTLPDGRASVVLVSESHGSPHALTRFAVFALYRHHRPLRH
jgi:Esterase-like activity of phytase